MNLEARMFMSNHKTVFVIDHTSYFGISCEDLMEFDLSKTRGLNVIPLAPISKSLWTCSIEAAIEYCRIVWDLFPSSKLIRFIASDSTAHHFNSWEKSQQSISHLLNASAHLGVPPRTHQQGDSVIHGLTAAVEAMTECSEIQHAKRTSLTENAVKLLNKCRVICITSTRDNSSMKSLQEIFLKVLVQQNKVAAATDHLITVHHCHLVVINIYPNNSETQVTDQAINELSPLLTTEVHSVCAGKGLANKLSHLILGHYGLASTTVTGIPMKEEQNASSSANYDVEIFHHANAHLDQYRAAGSDSVLIKTKKEGADYDTVTLKWCTPRGSSGHELISCTAAYRVTPVDVNSRPSSCLINFLLNGRSVMLEMPKRAGGKTISHLLTSHGGEIFIHALATGRSVLEDPPSISEGCGGRVTDYRITDFGVLMQNNILVPLQGKLVDGCTDKINLPINRMKSRLDRQTKYWPITISGTFIMNLRQYIDPLPQLMTKEELTAEEVAHCKQVITSLVSLEMKHEPLIQPNTGVRGKGQKREEQYKIMWNELEKFVRTHCRSDQHNKVLHCLLECRNKEIDNKMGSEKVELDQALRELDVMTSKYSENYGVDSSVGRATVIRATTDSPMSPPPVSKSASPLLSNSRSGRSTATSSIYSGPRTLMDLWSGKISAEGRCVKEKRPEFFGRVNSTTLYSNLTKDDRERNSRNEDMMVIE